MKMNTPKYLSTAEMKEPEKYITRTGRLLRKLSIDEVPQLINVLKGDMSIVGPRPLISDEFDIHEARCYYGVYSVRPGMTGLAQINGRDTIASLEKVCWDIRYVQNFGPWIDLKILFRTFPRVFGSVGVVDGYSFNRDEAERIEVIRPRKEAL